MNIIFNHDGSIKNLNLNEIIVQGNNLVNEIQIAIEGRTPDDYVATAYFTLPDGTSNYLTGSADNFSIDQTPYSGYSINLTSAQTVMAGEVGMTIQCTDANSHVLCTYKVKLTINESGYIPEATTITMKQLQSLLDTLSTFQLKYVAPNVRSYPSLEDAEEDLENLADKQIIVIGDTEDDTPSTPISFYYKYNDALVPFDFGYGFIELDVGEVSGYLTDFQTAQARKSVCFIKRGSVIYYAQESYSDGATRYFYAIPLWATGSAYVAKFIEVGFYDNQTTWDYGDTKVYTDSTPTDGSLNLVTSNGVYDAIATAIANLKTLIEGEISALDDLGIVVINDSNDHKNGILDTYQQSQAQKPYVIIKYINSDDLVTYFVSQFDYAEETPNTKSFQSIAGWVSSSEEGISGQYKSSTIVIDDLYTEYPSWELDESAQKVDEEPTEDSYNLVTSGGVYDAIASAKSTIEGEISTAIEGVEGEISSLTRTLIHKDDYSTASTSFDAYGVAPKALPKASLDGFLGNSVVRNQLVPNNYMTATVEITQTMIEQSSNWLDYLWEFQLGGNPRGHKYCAVVQIDKPYLCLARSYDAANILTGGSTTTYTQANGVGIQTWDSNASTIKIALKRTSDNSGNLTTGTAHIKVWFFDLVVWFGSNDLIPADLLSTPSIFLSKYAYGMDLSFNTGTLVDGTLTKLKANPFNAWDEEWEVGGYGLNGEAIDYATTIRSKAADYIEVMSNLTYYVYLGGNTSLKIYIAGYDSSKNFVGYLPNASGINQGTFSIPSNCKYIRFQIGAAYGTTYNHNICINLSSSLNGTYLPHANPIQTPLSIGTMRSAGSVRDTNELTKVGQVDLSTLEFSMSGTYLKRAVLSGAKGVTSGSNLANAMCSNRTNAKYNDIYNSYGNGFTIFDVSGTVYVYCQLTSESDTTATTGTLNYELATPTARETTFPEIIDIHSGGIIEAEFADLPITTQITYLEEE